MAAKCFVTQMKETASPLRAATCFHASLSATLTYHFKQKSKGFVFFADCLELH